MFEFVLLYVVFSLCRCSCTVGVCVIDFVTVFVL